MPTYEYECSKCGQTFEYFQSMKDKPLTDCLDQACGGKGTLKRLIGGGGGLIFKGSGFYATDYKKSGNGGGPVKSKEKKEAPASEACASCPKDCPAKES